MGNVEEIFVPYPAAPEQLGTATLVRTTLLVSSLQSLRRHDHGEAYLKALPREHHETMLSMIAGQWVPMSLALAHYRACESLGIPHGVIHAIGREVGDRIEGTFLATMVRMAGKAGATPWTAVAQLTRLYDRLFDGGGGTQVVKEGPKDVRIEFVGLPLCSIPYWRAASCAVVEVGMELFCTRAYVKEVPGTAGFDRVILRAAWA